MLVRLWITVGFDACYLMELCSNCFPVYAPVWKAKIRKVAADFANQSSGRPSVFNVTVVRKRKIRVVREISSGNIR